MPKSASARSPSAVLHKEHPCVPYVSCHASQSHALCDEGLRERNNETGSAAVVTAHTDADRERGEPPPTPSSSTTAYSTTSWAGSCQSHTHTTHERQAAAPGHYSPSHTAAYVSDVTDVPSAFASCRCERRTAPSADLGLHSLNQRDSFPIKLQQRMHTTDTIQPPTQSQRCTIVRCLGRHRQRGCAGALTCPLQSLLTQRIARSGGCSLLPYKQGNLPQHS